MLARVSWLFFLPVFISADLFFTDQPLNTSQLVSLFGINVEINYPSPSLLESELSSLKWTDRPLIILDSQFLIDNLEIIKTHHLSDAVILIDKIMEIEDLFTPKNKVLEINPHNEFWWMGYQAIIFPKYDQIQVSSFVKNSTYSLFHPFEQIIEIDFEEGEEKAVEALKNGASSFWRRKLLFLEGVFYLEKGEVKKAIAQFLSLLHGEKNPSSLFLWLAKAERERGDSNAAKRYLRMAMANSGFFPEGREKKH